MTEYLAKAFSISLILSTDNSVEISGPETSAPINGPSFATSTIYFLLPFFILDIGCKWQFAMCNTPAVDSFLSVLVKKNRPPELTGGR
jgi:hypothetical protein